MKNFKINEKIDIVCESKKTRNGFKHTATLLFDGCEQEDTKICYLNRTWESYEYESVLSKLVERSTSLSNEEKNICKNFIKGDHTDWNRFKSTKMIAQMGNIFCENQKEKNDWKLRMLKAGLTGINVPKDWDQLDESTKEERLNNVIAELGRNKQ